MQTNRSNNHRTANSVGKLDDLARARLQQWLEASDVTQEQMAAVLGKRQGYISRYLTHGGRLELDALERLARLFGHSVAELLAEASTADPSAAVLADLNSLPRDLRASVARCLHDLAVAVRRPRGRRRARTRR